MRYVIFIFLGSFLVFSCQNHKQDKKKAIAGTYNVYGDTILIDGLKTADWLGQTYTEMAPNDTVQTTFSAKVVDVCPKKGCWMKLDLGEDKESMVRFKDYGFFVPKDIAGKEVVLSGVAFIDKVSVEDQRHYAEDAGKTKEEIEAITEPKVTYTFEANGVLIKK